jgi:hypothetical protein
MLQTKGQLEEVGQRGPLVRPPSTIGAEDQIEAQV